MTSTEHHLADKIITCRECGRQFAFTVGEQEFFAQKGFTNDPSRCPECRAARKAGHSGDSTSSIHFGSGGDRSRRDMHPAVCARCGKDTQVPFLPKGDRPVYCPECFDAIRRGEERW